MKFAVDKMLGRLAKWLRILGYDTLFNPYVPSATVIKQAVEEKRIFITRDSNAAANPKVSEIFLVHSERYREQLREVVDHFQLDVSSKLFTRCTICNVEIVSVEKESIKTKLPEKSAMNFDRFYQCPNCNRIYWEGTHTENTRKRLKEILSP